MPPGSAHVRRFATLPKGSGGLSGLVLDREGGVWTTRHDVAMDTLANAPASGHLFHIRLQVEGLAAHSTLWGITS
jgi:sugar lactone lactonase YvrE